LATSTEKKGFTSRDPHWAIHDKWLKIYAQITSYDIDIETQGNVIFRK